MLYLLKNNKMKKIIFPLFLLLSFQVLAQQSLLENGPMLGYSTMNEVMIWAQTKQAADVKVSYQAQGTHEILWTNTVHTTKAHAFTAHLLADNILPGTKYIYNLYINNKKIDKGFETYFTTKEIWKYRKDPPDFSFATGSGAYINEAFWDRPGKPYGKDFEIYDNIAKKNPDFMLWLGDNIYLRQNEWNSWTGIAHRYTHDRKLPQLQHLLANCNNYAILDDHDMGPNDCDGSYALKDISIGLFKDFWANPPQIPGLKGATTFFNWNDVDFFLMDNRYYRDPDRLKAENKTELGKKQLKWLEDALVSSHATFKIVALGGQFLTTAENYETYSNFNFKNERNQIIDFIQKQNIKNVIFLTGDRHFTELSILKQDGKPTIYDLTVSAFTSGENVYAFDEINKYRIKGTVVMSHNFGIISFSGKRKHRAVTFTIFDKNGKEIWSKKFEQE